MQQRQQQKQQQQQQTQTSYDPVYSQLQTPTNSLLGPRMPLQAEKPLLPTPTQLQCCSIMFLLNLNNKMNH